MEEGIISRKSFSGAWIVFTAGLLISSCDLLPFESCQADLQWRLTPTAAILRVGQSVVVKAEALGCGGTKPLEEDMRWTSQDTAIADVEERSGKVTARAVGETTIIGEDLGKYGIGPFTVPVTVTP